MILQTHVTRVNKCFKTHTDIHNNNLTASLLLENKKKSVYAR